MAENPFRILLDFRELNFRFYKFVWMSISPRELLTISDLKDAILKKFSFERTDLLLFLRDGLLPDDENIINILRENDSVRLFYAESTNLNLSNSKIINYEVEQSANDDKVKSPEKRKEHSDTFEDNNEQEKPNKKRRCSFSNGTYVFKSNSPSENSTSINTVSNDTENIASADLYNFERGKHKLCKIKKKLKYSNGVSENSLVPNNEIFLSSDIIPALEKNQSKVNFCKKKKKHKHSKDMSEISSNSKNEHRVHKKKKYKHSHDASKIDSVSETAVSFYDEIIGIPEKLDDSAPDLETKNELSELKESIFETVTENSEVLKLAPVSFCAPSVSTSSGIGDSLKTSEENNQKIFSEQNCSKSYVSDYKASALETEKNVSFSEGNNCKKKKRKRHKKRKPVLIYSQIDESNDFNLDISSQKNENECMKNTSALYYTAEISPRNKEILNISKSNEFLFRKSTNCSETKSSFLEPFGNYLPNTSTPFPLIQAASPRKNIVSKMPSSSNASEDQSYSVTASQNTILPAIQKKMNENLLSIQSSSSSITENKNNASVSSRNFNEKSLSVKINDSSAKSTDLNENSLSIHSSSGSITENKNNATVSSRNFHEKGSPVKINNSSAKSTDSFSNIGTKRQFLDPNLSYKSCLPLNSCPLVGTHIAYKVLELDASYSPVVSNYKEGIVKAVNSQTDELEIELVEPEVKEGRAGKFEILYEDELPPCEVIKNVTLSWPSLIDPVRVIC